MEKVFEMREKWDWAGLSLSFTHSFSVSVSVFLSHLFHNPCTRECLETNPVLLRCLCLKCFSASLKFSEKCILFPSFIYS
uniref:SJCHGC09736 protein n=1 Tax=Schistosoma japonicum TaxID=6182 RepID=Q5BR06_SCHJA|nr:SJCHGC09736 protein [Schistosoma japonicum]